MEVSSERAVNLANMSRVELEHLLDVGVMPSRCVDGQRMVDLADVIAYKKS